VIVTSTSLKDCFLIEPKVHKDSRGVFLESFNKRVLEKKLGTTLNFVQDNHSVSKKGVLRGLHFQKGRHSQAKLVRVIKGEVLDVVVDLRKESPTYRKCFKIRLSGENNQLVFIPKGMAHGFLALKNDTIFTYKCDEYYHKESEAGIIFNDKDLNIDWKFPVEEMILSEKDRNLPRLKELSL
jgi:dTDP-4-dehydrorhamnose 3,5-epimerase